ncbi:MAG: helix-turn-helix transcriptional regulator [Verrucomicrobiia bacterium]
MRQVRLTLSDAFSQVVAKHREEKGLSRAALARLASLHQTYIGLLERGERTPNLDTANAIARALGKSLEGIITEAGKLQKTGKCR